MGVAGGGQAPFPLQQGSCGPGPLQHTVGCGQFLPCYRVGGGAGHDFASHPSTSYMSCTLWLVSGPPRGKGNQDDGDRISPRPALPCLVPEGDRPGVASPGPP